MTYLVYDGLGQLAAEYRNEATGGADKELGTRYVHRDGLGSVRLVTGPAGDVRRRLDYLPFGEEVPGSMRPYSGYQNVLYPGPMDAVGEKFTGKERDAETGLDYFGARYFSGAQGRFTSPDPENANAMVSDPQSWNMYAYGRNNPLSYVDPDGLAYRVCQVDENGKETNCTTQKNELSDKQFEQFKKDNKGSLIFAGGKVYGVNEDGSRGAQTGTYKQTDVDIDNPAFGAVAQGIQAASPVTDPRFIAGFYGASALGGLALYGGGAFAGGQLTTLGLQTSAATATEGSTALAGTLNLSKHAVQRMAERGFTRDMIQATIKNGTRYWDPKNGTFNYVLRGGFASGKNALVGVNPVTNVVTTVIRGGGIPARLIPF
jgi:RHS repeat-associated protein